MATRFQPVPTYADPVLTGRDKKTGKEKSAFNPVWLAWFLQLTNGQSLGSITNHNDLADIQGGGPGQFYHLTSAEYNAINYFNRGALVSLPPDPSPWGYQNAHSYDVDIVIVGGTLLTNPTFTRDGITFVEVGDPRSMITLSPGDTITIAYTVVPTAVWEIPR